MTKTKIAKKEKPKTMTINEIDEKASSLGIKTGNLPLAQIIRDIQVAEGHKVCFGRSGSECSETECCFMDHCLETESTGSDQGKETVEQSQDSEQDEAAVQESRERLEQRFTSGKDINEINVDITQEMADIFSMVKSLEGQVETSSKANEELNANFAETQQKLSEQSETRAKLEERLETVEEQAAQAGELSKDIAYTENERKKLSKLLAESHQQLQALTGDYKLLSDRVTAADARAKNAARLEKEVKTLQEKLEASDDQMSSIQKQLEKQNEYLATANETLQQEVAKRKKSEQVMAEVKKRLKGLSI
jgi:chromosome segregation ATPase